MNQAETVAMFNNPAHRSPHEAFVNHVFSSGVPWPQKPLSRKTGKGMRGEPKMRHPRMGKRKHS